MKGSLLVKPKYIKKHNAAIRSYSDMTLLQRKLANTLLYNAYHELEKKNFHEISIPTLLSLLCMKTNDYKKLKQAILKLMTTIIEWNVIRKSEDGNMLEINKKGESWKACTMLSSVEIKGTTIRYEYSHMLREQLYNPSFYSKVNLNIQNKFRSLYSLALYENSLSYVNCGSSGWIPLSMFRKLMGVNELEYKEFRDFNKRVLKSSIIEVNESSEIEVKYEIRKESRLPSFIKLIVLKKQRQPQENSNEIFFGDIVERKMLTFGFSSTEIYEILEKYSRDDILEKIELIDHSKSKINFPKAFLKAALKNNYKQNELGSISPSIDYFKEKEEEKKRELLKDEYRKYIDELVKQWLLNLSEKEKMFLIERINIHCESSSLPTCKRAGSKLSMNSLVSDVDVFFSIKAFIFSNKDQSSVNFEFPKIITIEEFSMTYTVC